MAAASPNQAIVAHWRFPIGHKIVSICTLRQQRVAPAARKTPAHSRRHKGSSAWGAIDQPAQLRPDRGAYHRVCLRILSQFLEYADRDESSPVDQHELLALI